MLRFAFLKFSGIDGQPKVRFTGQTLKNLEDAANAKDLPFTIEATRQGIALKGEIELAEEDLQVFVKAIATAMTESRKLRPTITRNISGH